MPISTWLNWKKTNSNDKNLVVTLYWYVRTAAGLQIKTYSNKNYICCISDLGHYVKQIWMQVKSELYPPPRGILNEEGDKMKYNCVVQPSSNAFAGVSIKLRKSEAFHLCYLRWFRQLTFTCLDFLFEILQWCVLVTHFDCISAELNIFSYYLFCFRSKILKTLLIFSPHPTVWRQSV